MSCKKEMTERLLDFSGWSIRRPFQFLFFRYGEENKGRYSNNNSYDYCCLQIKQSYKWFGVNTDWKYKKKILCFWRRKGGGSSSSRGYLILYLNTEPISIWLCKFIEVSIMSIGNNYC